MARIALCQPRRLYNILNQYRRFPRLSEPNYLCLLDARTQREYNESHIITARRIEQGTVLQRLQRLTQIPPVHRELDNLQLYPVEILEGKLYMGNFKQACDKKIQKDLKIKAQVNISEEPATLFAEGDNYLHISVPDAIEADLFSSFATISHFIDAQLEHGAVLVFSKLGISRSSTAIMAYLIHSHQFSLKKAWYYVLECKMNMIPHRGFVKQLLDWETKVYGVTLTDFSELNY
nr:serine/threonine/tyrosine-interacting-like protein 1 isoform X2 [Columba livia]